MLAGLIWVGLGRASAQEPKPSNVLIVRVAGDENIVVRLRAELSSYRFRVIEQHASARRSKELAELAEERDAQAALRAKPEAMAVDLWVRAGGRTSEEVVSAGPGRNPEVLALRVTEAMRARGLALPPLVAAGAKGVAADSGRRGGPAAADGSRRAGPGAAADSSKTGVAADGSGVGAAVGSSKRSGDASTQDSDDPGVAEPTVPPPAATPIVSPSKAGEPDADPARASLEAQKLKPAEAAERKAAEAAERKAAEAAERKAAEAAERKAAEAAERRAAEAAERKAAEAAERKAPDAERKTAEAAERKAADAERKAAEAAARKAAEAERKAAEAAERKAEAERKAAEATAAGPADESDDAAPEPENTTPVVPRKALVYAEVGPSGVWSPGENRVGPTLDAMISVRFRPDQTSSISLVGLIPLLTTDLQTTEGAPVEVRTYAIGGFGDLHLALGRVELSAGLGALALLTSVMVYNTDLLYGSDNLKTQRLAALLGRAGASFAITRDLRISGSVMAGLTVKELRLQFPRPPGDGTDTNKPDVTWGHPLLIGNLSLELALPWDR